MTESTDRDTLRELTQKRVKDENMVNMVEHTHCQDVQGFVHESVKHGVGEHMKNQAHTNDAYNNTGMKHFLENVLEFASLLNSRPPDTRKQVYQTVNDLFGQGLRYKALVA